MIMTIESTAASAGPASGGSESTAVLVRPREYLMPLR